MLKYFVAIQICQNGVYLLDDPRTLLFLLSILIILSSASRYSIKYSHQQMKYWKDQTFSRRVKSSVRTLLCVLILVVFVCNGSQLFNLTAQLKLSMTGNIDDQVSKLPIICFEFTDKPQSGMFSWSQNWFHIQKWKHASVLVTPVNYSNLLYKTLTVLA